ncbi:MAG: hypothetical protein WDN06_21075 [Asticcacaulis sp.]
MADGLENVIAPYLVDVWVDSYTRYTPLPSMRSLAVIDLEDFFYLFDTHNERLVAAWGISEGRGTQTSSGNSPMREPVYRSTWGHAISHITGGGGGVIMLRQFDQLDDGSFTKLESLSLGAPGALYFNAWNYDGSPGVPIPGSMKVAPGQTPVSIDQGLIIPGRSASITSVQSA